VSSVPSFEPSFVILYMFKTSISSTIYMLSTRQRVRQCQFSINRSRTTHTP